MASFCGNCGSPLGANVAFCPQCGAAAGNRPQPAAAQPVAPAAAPVAKSSSAFKIVVAVLCFLALGAVAVVGGSIYLAHRVKQAVVEKASEYGVDLHPHERSSSGASSSSSAAMDPAKDPCRLLSKEEASSFLGEPIERTERQNESCLYYGPPGLSEKLGKRGMSKMVNKPDSSLTGTEVADGVDRFMKGIAAANGTGGSGGDYPLVTVMVTNDGPAQMSALSASKALLSGLTGSAEEIPGLGDRAIRLANLGLNVLKGDTLIRILPGPVPDANRKCVALARTILPRI